MSDKFHWFRGATVDALKDQLNAGNVDRIEVHHDGDAMTFHVIYGATPTPEVHATPLNESFICPPICP